MVRVILHCIRRRRRRGIGCIWGGGREGEREGRKERVLG